jgi:hypothetical protein
MAEYLHNAPVCPGCGASLSGATSTENPRDDLAPREDDVSICIYCFAVTQFTAAGDLVLADLNTLPTETQGEIARALLLIRHRWPNGKTEGGA